MTHFARHLQRKHKDEKEVEEIFKLEKNSAERKDSIEKIRKRGNFNLMLASDEWCPVKRPAEAAESVEGNNEFLPCSHCLGLYKKNSLYRHVKTCKQNQN